MKESKFYQEIMEEGVLKKARADVIHALTLRFGSTAAAEFRQYVSDVVDEQQLTDLHGRAILCHDLNDFRRSFRSIISNR